jgi:hypothetical protein
MLDELQGKFDEEDRQSQHRERMAIINDCRDKSEQMTQQVLKTTTIYTLLRYIQLSQFSLILTMIITTHFYVL